VIERYSASLHKRSLHIYNTTGNRAIFPRPTFGGSVMTPSSPTAEAAVSASIFAQAQEKRRVRKHLRRVEDMLRRQPASRLSQELRAVRGRHLDALHSYLQQGRFPRNFDHPGKQVPCFIDRGGHVCAVAHLLIESGHAPLATQVAATTNNALIAEIHASAFDEWVAGSGLPKDELARIQPMYPHFEEIQQLNAQTTSLTQTLFIIGPIALVATIVNFLFQGLERIERVARIGQILGIITGLILLYHFVALTNAHDRLMQLYGDLDFLQVFQEPQLPGQDGDRPYSAELRRLQSYIWISLVFGVVALISARRTLFYALQTIAAAFRGLRDRTAGLL
jgi:hypothetical protein